MLDEADEMLDMGFREDLQFILETTPAERRTLLFSATLPKAIVTLAKHYQRDALAHRHARRNRAAMPISNIAPSASPATRSNAPWSICCASSIRPARWCSATPAMRCATWKRILHGARLCRRGAVGRTRQSERNHALQALRDGRARVCVATDVAARGIDLPNLSLVIHADLPNDAEVLQHRSGRTGRAGSKGVSVLLVPPSRRRRAEEMLGRARVNAVWGDAPSAEDIRKLDQERLLQNPILAEPGTRGRSGDGR